MTAARTHNNLSPEFAATLQKIHQMFSSHEFIIVGGTTMLVAPFVIFKDESAQIMATISTTLGFVCVAAGVTLKIIDKYYLSQPHPISASRDTSATKPSVIPHQRDTSAASHKKEKKLIPTALRKAINAQQRRQEKEQKDLKYQAKSWWAKNTEKIGTLIKKYRFTSQSVPPSLEENKKIEETNLDKQELTKHFSPTQKNQKNKKTKKKQKNIPSKNPSQTPSGQQPSSLFIIKNTSANAKTLKDKKSALTPPSVAARSNASSTQPGSDQSKQKIKENPVLTSTPVTPLSNASSIQPGSDQSEQEIKKNPVLTSQPVPDDQRGWVYALQAQRAKESLAKKNKQLKEQIKEEKNKTTYFFELSKKLIDTINAVSHPYYYDLARHEVA